MPRSRGSELPQRPSPRAPLHLKTTACSEANAFHRSIVDRSPKLDDRRSPRSPLHEIQKKRGTTKVADLETKLSKAQEELKKLRDQLASAEAAKIDAEDALQKAKKQIPTLSSAATKASEEEKPPLTSSSPPPTEDSHEKSNIEQEPQFEEESSVTFPATNEVVEVFIVSTEAIHDEKEDCGVHVKEDGEETKATTLPEKDKDSPNNEGNVIVAVQEVEEEKKEEEVDEKEEVEEPEVTEPAEPQENPEIVELKSNIFEKEREVEFLLEENAIFKRKAKEEAEKITAAARAKEEALTAKLRSTEAELKESRDKAAELEVKLEVAQGAKEALEEELKRLKVQTYQWRKAAETAASVLADGDGELGGRRCGSMEKHIGGGGVFADWGSTMMVGEMEDEGMAGGGRRKAGAGIRMFGDIWKKKGQHK